MIGNEITCFFEIAHSHRHWRERGVSSRFPLPRRSIFKSVIPILERVNFDNHFGKNNDSKIRSKKKERFRPILIEWQRTSVLTTASGLYFMLWIPRAAPLHRALAPVSRGDLLAGNLVVLLFWRTSTLFPPTPTFRQD